MTNSPFSTHSKTTQVSNGNVSINVPPSISGKVHSNISGNVPANPSHANAHATHFSMNVLANHSPSTHFNMTVPANQSPGHMNSDDAVSSKSYHSNTMHMNMNVPANHSPAHMNSDESVSSKSFQLMVPKVSRKRCLQLHYYSL